MAYIEKEKLMELSQDITTFDYQTKSFGCFSGVSDEDIAKMPIADVVGVVYCKDCKYFTKEMIADDLEFICKSAEGMVNPAPDKYCSYGTPKERGGE